MSSLSTSHEPRAESPRTAALIPAAGSGTRLGLGPKALLRLGGQSLLSRSVAALRSQVDEVVVALPEGVDVELPPGVRVVIGGATRQASVWALLQATDAEVVLIHDAARPFTPPEVIAAVKAAATQMGAATAALPLADTLVRSQGENWGHLIPREALWAVQTPQGFERTLLLRAHAEAGQQGIRATDDAGLVARLGHPVRLIPGDARMFKITTPGDWALARSLAAAWDAK